MTAEHSARRRLVRRAVWIILAVLVAAVVFYSAFSSGSESAADRAHRLASEIRCPDCQGLSAEESETPSAHAIRADVRRRISASQSDAQIRQAFVDRYGEFILLRPSTNGIGLFVWVLPVLALLVGGGALALALRRWNRQPRLEATDADRDLVARVRQARDPATGGVTSGEAASTPPAYQEPGAEPGPGGVAGEARNPRPMA